MEHPFSFVATFYHGASLSPIALSRDTLLNVAYNGLCRFQFFMTEK